MKINSKKYLIITCIIIEILSLFLTFKSFSNRNIEEIKEIYEVDKKMFAMYTEQEDGSYTEYTDSNYFPSDGYRINLEKSNCIDNKGNKIEGVITNTSSKVTVSSNKTTYCYLYFDIDSSVYAKLVSDYNNSNGVSKISSTSAETGNTYDAYYYTGSITNNNILYANHCWKMVISTETKGVKLIYNGVPTTGTDDAGNTTYSCDNTGTASQLSSTKAFNSSRNSPAYVGYMYNTAYKVEYTTSSNKPLTNSTTVLISQSSMTSSSHQYYFGDSVTYKNGTYTLNNPSTYTWADSYADLVGYYTCRSTTATSCKSVSYVTVAGSSTMYYYNLSSGNDYNYYNLKYATEVISNEDGTYTLVNPIEVTRAEYYENYSNYINHYYCGDTTSETCSDMYYSYSTSSTALSYVYVAKNYKYGNSFEYDYDTGTYKLIDTNTSSIKQFWNWYTNYNTLNNNHYTCFNTSGECTSLYYINYTNNTTAYYITLTGGKTVEEAINEMLYADDVNTTDSTIKDYIDTWYEDTLLDTEYENYLENAIFCNNRAMTNQSSNGWNPNGGSTTTAYMYFNYNSLECANKTDRFTLKTSMGGTEGYGNNALDYPIGLISYKEASLATASGYLKSGQNYWLLSPHYSLSAYAVGFGVASGGKLNSTGAPLALGVRPSVSLSNKVEITEGDGSATTPYQVILPS